MTSGVYERSKETKRRMSEKNAKFWLGKRLSKEHKIKISESSKGEKNHNFGKRLLEETKRKMKKNNARFWLGKHKSKETKIKMSESHKGKKGYWFGKHRSEETKRKCREKRKFIVIPFKDTKPETKLQEALTSKNIMFRKHEPITGQPDIFIKPNICVFVDGCFWHSCPVHFNLENEYAIKRKTRDEYVNKTLSENGYKVLRFWECEINTGIENCVKKFMKFIEKSNI